jgi:uncharacterized protein DUF397
MAACDDPVLCVEVVAHPFDNDKILIRESERPNDIVETSRVNWDAFVAGVKAGNFDNV